MSRHVLILAAAAIFALFFELGRMDVVMDNEGQRTVPPLEMIHSGDYVVPTLNGDTYLAKPPLLYWAIAGVYTITGSTDEWAARFPTAACAVLLALAIYLVFRREAGEMPALWTGLILVTSYYFLERARWAELDVPLSLAVFLAIMAYRKACEEHVMTRRSLFIAITGVALGAAIMLKGPTPLPFLWAAWAGYHLSKTNGPPVPRYAPVITAAAVLLETLLWALGNPIGFPIALVLALVVWSAVVIQRAGRDALRNFAWLACVLLIGAALAAPWGIAVLRNMGWDYLQTLLHYQVVERTYTASEINSGSPFFYIIALPALLAPWGLFLPLHLSRHYAHSQPPIYRFALGTGWLSVLVFSLIAGKENEYILPAFAFLLLPTGFHLAQISEQFDTAWFQRWRGFCLGALRVLMIVVAIGGPLYVLIEMDPSAILIAEVVAASLAALTAFALLRGTPRKRLWGLWVMVLFMMVAGLTIRGYHYTGSNSFRPIGNLAGDLVRGGHDVAVSRLYPALVHYSDGRVPVETDMIKAEQKLSSDKPYYLILRDKEWDLLRLRGDFDNVDVLAGPWSNKDLVLIGNAPLPVDPPMTPPVS